MNNFNNKIDFSTFLENGKIIIKNNYRYFIFTTSGIFIDQASFEDEATENDTEIPT